MREASFLISITFLRKVSISCAALSPMILPEKPKKNLQDRYLSHLLNCCKKFILIEILKLKILSLRNGVKKSLV